MRVAVDAIRSEDGKSTGYGLRDARLLQRQKLNIVSAVQLDLCGFRAGNQATANLRCRGLNQHPIGFHREPTRSLGPPQALRERPRFTAHIHIYATEDRFLEALKRREVMVATSTCSLKTV